MIGTGVAANGFSRPQEQITQGARLPAPYKGVDTRAALGAMSQENCIYAFNLVPEEFGLKIRPGSREWQVELESSTGLGVKTIMAFEGLDSSKLFAVTNEGIWDVTVAEATPILKFAFVTNTTAAAGHGVFTNYITAAGDQLMFYADSKNGLFTYTESTNAWTVTTGITGPTIANIVYVVVHKLRIWFIEKEATFAWYLPIASKAGSATQFFFGPKFPHGGTLRALINWSVDGGKGIDDYLVAVSSSGDVVPYRGADPSVAEGAGAAAENGWAVVGSYFIGQIPAGVRFYSEHSGELYILSSFGLIGMSDLLRGVNIKDKAGVSLTYPIASILRETLLVTGNTLGWEPIFLPSAGILLITSPVSPATGRYIQYSMSLAVEGWGFWRDASIEVAFEWNKKIYFGTADNRVMIMDVTRDEVLIDAGAENAAGTTIGFSVLTAYNDADSSGKFKIPSFVRPDFLSVSPPEYQTKMFFDYAVAEEIFAIGSIELETEGNWDVSLWDEGIWGSGDLISEHQLQGSAGLGRTMAIALLGESGNTTRLISYDIMWREGGFI